MTRGDQDRVGSGLTSPMPKRCQAGAGSPIPLFLHLPRIPLCKPPAPTSHCLSRLHWKPILEVGSERARMRLPSERALGSRGLPPSPRLAVQVPCASRRLAKSAALILSEVPIGRANRQTLATVQFVEGGGADRVQVHAIRLVSRSIPRTHRGPGCGCTSYPLPVLLPSPLNSVTEHPSLRCG